MQQQGERTLQPLRLLRRRRHRHEKRRLSPSLSRFVSKSRDSNRMCRRPGSFFFLSLSLTIESEAASREKKQVNRSAAFLPEDRALSLLPHSQVDYTPFRSLCDWNQGTVENVDVSETKAFTTATDVASLCR